ncbi:immunoglobulin I-set domain protein [mine drainage metagenome]|uniref:Immunoglobulin I-set domain protein n=1 Tax=mine drainage metagenome TaxID=410659 RepID=A0A1J5SY28_9ZZZZ
MAPINTVVSGCPSRKSAPGGARPTHRRAAITRAGIFGVLLWLLAFVLATPVLAQPVAPSPEDLQQLRADLLRRSATSLQAAIATPTLSVDLSTRAEARAFFRTLYGLSDNIPIQWTGSLTGTPGTSATGTPGTTAAAFKDAVQLRINWFRAMAGVPASITFNDTYSSADQQAALMMSANNTLNHNPPSTWLLYTSTGANAASNSNLSLGSDGADAISAYMVDYGSNNAEVGHRRWLLYPQTQTMGTGDIPATGSFPATNATWVIDGYYGTTRPAVRDSFVAWPPPGYVPYEVVYPRWSISYPGADFSSATVSMTRNGSPIQVSVAAPANGYGENTLVWVYDGLDANTVETPAPKPSADTVYAVSVKGALINGVSTNFNYNVTVFDPAVAGPGDVPVSVSGTTQPSVNQPAAYSVALPPYSANFQWRTVASAPFTGTYGAEGGLQGVTAQTTGTYAVVDTSTSAAGSASYHLAQPTLDTQILTLPGTYSFASGPASLTFASRLGWASTTQTAHVQISLDDGQNWTDLYTQSGTNSAGETSFVARSIPLDAYAGLTFQIRFTYTYDGGTYYPQTDSGVGWNLDQISFAGISSATTGTASAIQSGTGFSYTPASTATVGLQARGVLFGTYGMDWGTVLQTTALATAGTPPSITTQPASVTVKSGQSASFSVQAAGTAPFAYQWYKDGTAIAGATSATLTLSPVSTFSAGGYSVVVSNGSGSATSSPATLTVIPVNHFLAISTRCYVGTGDSIGVPAFILKQDAIVLIRAGGPSLANYNVANVLAKPKLTLFDGKSIPRLSNQGWQNAPVYLNGTTVAANGDYGTSYDLSQISTAVGAYTFTTADDSAVAVKLPAGVYTVQVTGADGGSGNALAEVYLYQPSTDTATGDRFSAISTRCYVGTGDSIAVVGLSIQKSAKVLLRAVGPSLAAQGVSGTIAKPSITLYDGKGNVIASNTGWESDAAQATLIAQAAAAVGEFPLTSPDDSALLVTLPAGLYTAQVKGADGGSGNALVEAYLVSDGN